MAFKDALKNAKKKGGKKIPPKGNGKDAAIDDKQGKGESDDKNGKGFAAAFANAKGKKKKGGK